MKYFTLLLLIILIIACGCTNDKTPATSENKTQNQPSSANLMASIDSISPENASAGQKLSFKGHGTSTNDKVAAYSWRSDKDGNLSSLAQFETTKLSAGTHTIFFKVQDTRKVWSPEVQNKITISGSSASIPGATSTSNLLSRVTEITSIKGTPSGTYQCPFSMAFSGSITTDGPCTVTYRWERSDGTKGPTESIMLYDAGTRDVNYSWVAPSSGDYWVLLRTLTPNEITSVVFTVSVTCGPGLVIDVVSIPSATTDVTRCPSLLNFAAAITMDGPGTVKYIWMRSDGTTSPAMSIVFTTAGTKNINYSWNVTKDGEYWARIYIVTPNVMKAANIFPVNVSCRGLVTSVVPITGDTSKSYMIRCPVTLVFAMDITVDGPCSVRYVWERSDGTPTKPSDVITFSSAGTKRINHSWEIGKNGDYWARVNIDSPNIMVSNYITITVSCY